MEARRGDLIDAGRRVLLRLLLAGRPTVTADDVREEIELPAGIDPRFFGSVPGELARAGIIRSAGYVKTTRPEGHARPIIAWELSDREAAERWLRNHPGPAPQPQVSTSARQLGIFEQAEGGVA